MNSQVTTLKKHPIFRGVKSELIYQFLSNFRGFDIYIRSTCINSSRYGTVCRSQTRSRNITIFKLRFLDCLKHHWHSFFVGRAEITLMICFKVVKQRI